MEKQAIIYARVSTVAQNTDRQVRDLMDYAQSTGYHLMQTFTEQLSGAQRNDQRQALTEALWYIPLIFPILTRNLTMLSQPDCMKRKVMQKRFFQR